jgi:hypothetical protein
MARKEHEALAYECDDNENCCSIDEVEDDGACYPQAVTNRRRIPEVMKIDVFWPSWDNPLKVKKEDQGRGYHHDQKRGQSKSQRLRKAASETSQEIPCDKTKKAKLDLRMSNGEDGDRWRSSCGPDVL